MSDPVRLASAFRQSPNVIVLVRVEDGSIVDVNPAFERWLGYAPATVLGKTPMEIGMWADLQVRAQMWSLIRSAGAVSGLPTSVRCADGRILEGALSCELLEIASAAYLLCIATLKRGDIGDTDDRGSYRSLYWGAAEGIYRRLPNGGFIDVNPAFAQLLGFDSPEQLMIATGRDSTGHYVEIERADELSIKLDREGRFENERSLWRRRDGAVLWVNENARMLRDRRGLPMFVEGSAVDISLALAAEAELRQSRAMYQVLVDSCRDGVFLVQNGVLRFVNEALARILRYPRQQLIGMSYLDLIHPDDRAAQLTRRQARESGSFEVQQYEVRVQRGDGSICVAQIQADGVIYEGHIASTGMLRDVTEDRRQRAALEAAERNYRELFEQSPVGLFKTHVDGRILEVNPALARMLGYPDPQALHVANQNILDIYARPEQRVTIVQQLLRDGSLRDFEFEVHLAGGGTTWLSLSSRVLTDEQGRPVEFAGTAQDISERRQMTRALQRSEAKYRLLVEHSQVGVFAARNARYTYVNATLAQLLGYSEAELISRPIETLVEESRRAEMRQRMHDIESGTCTQTEFESCYLRADGGRVWVTESIGRIEIDGAVFVSGTVRDVTRQRESDHRLRFHASHDSLTGLPNRFEFHNLLDERIRAVQAGAPADYAVLFLDLDGFKLVNDSLGHAAGDLLLVSLAEMISRELASEATVARYGGDEFTVLPHGACNAERGARIAQRIIALFHQPIDIGENQAFSGASIGIVLGNPEYSSANQVLRDADTAMYRAKAAGKAGFMVFDEAMHRAARARFALETELRGVLERGELVIYYQPVLMMDSGRIIGCEALLRWQHPQRGLLPPAEFLQVAEESGIIALLDGWVLREASQQVRRWQQRFPELPALRLNVNVDDRQMAGDTLPSEVAAALAESGLPADCLQLEITETVFRGGRQHVGEVLGALKRLGVGLVVDDFGTGYSSLDSFASSPFDSLKIDRGFIRDMESNPRHRAIVRTIAAFADDLGLSLTAEGVETVGQEQLLLGLGCRLAQGYRYSHPVTAVAFEQLLSAQRAALPTVEA